MPARSFLECPVFEAELASETVEAAPMISQDYTAAPCQQDVVISGVSCRLPESDNMAEYRDNLMDGIDMVTGDDRRWKPGILSCVQCEKTSFGFPTRCGTNQAVQPQKMAIEA